MELGLFVILGVMLLFPGFKVFSEVVDKVAHALTTAFTHLISKFG